MSNCSDKPSTRDIYKSFCICSFGPAIMLVQETFSDKDGVHFELITVCK